jgi:O-antigen ligase
VVFVLALLSVTSEFRSEARVTSGNARFQSFQVRRTVGGQALHLWRESPLLGRGIRVYEDPNSTLRSSPHNVVYEALVESGIVGLAALLILEGGVILVLSRAGTELSIAALAVVVATLTHGLFDLYWVAGTVTLTWLIVGIAAGATIVSTSACEPSDKAAPG